MSSLSPRDRTTDMNEPDGWEYKRPPVAQPLNYPVDVAEGHVVDVSQWLYRDMTVDFVFRHSTDSTEVARIDCCHNHVHQHQYRHDGSQLDVETIEVLTQSNPWVAIDRQFDPCFTRMVDGWHTQWDRWCA